MRSPFEHLDGGRGPTEGLEGLLAAMGKKRRLQLEEDLERLLVEAWGRRVLEWLVYSLGMLEGPSYNPRIHYSSELYAVRNEGIREMARNVRDLCAAVNPDGWSLAKAEADAQRRADIAARRQGQTSSASGEVNGNE